MTYVVTESCIKCKYTDCCVVCPTDAFHDGPNFLAIEPDDCIDCALCVVECPVDAIFADCDVPADQAHFVALNMELARIWKPIIEKKAPPPDAEAWGLVKDKINLLER
ncbi:MAG: ferredoxin FdxA [Casimicrobiaceae bacterium]